MEPGGGDRPPCSYATVSSFSITGLITDFASSAHFVSPEFSLKLHSNVELFAVDLGQPGEDITVTRLRLNVQGTTTLVDQNECMNAWMLKEYSREVLAQESADFTQGPLMSSCKHF